jgi:uncharacterized membrane protein (DUF485 family)
MADLLVLALSSFEASIVAGIVLIAVLTVIIVVVTTTIYQRAANR